MKKNLFFLVVFSAASFAGCKEEKKKNDYIPVISYLNSQVKHVDTSLYNIIKVDKKDSTVDTVHIKREEFRALAHDFLETPDLTDYSIGKKYKEEESYDESLQRIIFLYTPISGEPELIRQEVIVLRDLYSNDKIKSIIIEKIKETKDSIIHQRLLWQVDEKFQVVNIIDKKGQVYTRTTEVIWNSRPE